MTTITLNNGINNARPSSDALAIYGGPKAVAGEYRERWRAVTWRDILRVAKTLYKQTVTLADDSGVIGEFEKTFASLCGTKYALAMNSGTATLHSAYFALGIGPGDEVIVPTYTFFASAAPLLQLGAVPVFCDIDPNTLTLDPDDVERRITPKTKAICAVHVWGNPAAMDRIQAIAQKHNLSIVEDCSHAHGATYQGKPVGSWGDIGCFSLQGMKPVSGGEAGVAVTNDPVLFDRMLVLGHNGRSGSGQKAGTFSIDGMNLGVKYRPHLLGVTLALGSLERLETLNTLRTRNYAIMQEALEGCPGVSAIETYEQSARGGLLEFIFRLNSQQLGGWNRNALIRAIRKEGVPAMADRYGILLHRSRLFSGEGAAALERNFAGMGAFHENNALPRPAAEEACQELITLPPFTQVDEGYVRQCAKALRKVATVAASGSLL